VDDLAGLRMARLFDLVIKFVAGRPYLFSDQRDYNLRRARVPRPTCATALDVPSKLDFPFKRQNVRRRVIESLIIRLSKGRVDGNLFSLPSDATFVWLDGDPRPDVPPGGPSPPSIQAVDYGSQRSIILPPPRSIAVSPRQFDLRQLPASNHLLFRDAVLWF